MQEVDLSCDHVYILAGACTCPGCTFEPTKGDTLDEHPKGKQCTDPAQVLLGFAGQVVQGVCVECAIELLKRLL